ncbi:MAG: EAL domain-containing protein [Eggerthellaceae bacterium]|nr:EAL domain-containing protein [Eggerthellaceae bacterium]
MLTIPILLIGSFSFVFLNFPLPAYQDFLEMSPNFLGFFQTIYDVTLGLFSLYVVVSVSLSYTQLYKEKRGDFFWFGAPLASFGAYLVLVGIANTPCVTSILSSQSLAIALLSALGASALYCAFMNRFQRKQASFDNTSVSTLNQSLAAILPVVLIIVLAAGINFLSTLLFGSASLGELILRGLQTTILKGSTLGSGALYLFLDNFLWFFGLHGTNMLEGAAQVAFIPGAAENAAFVATGRAPTLLINKAFLQTFALIGGAGALLSLLLAIVVFGRKRNTKSLAGLAIVPMAFNAPELMLFGLPAIFNPLLFIPFIIVPLVSLLIAYVATVAGIVPYATVDVPFATPPFLSGYLVTGSYAGSVLQGVNIVVGMLIYWPFVRLYEKSLVHGEKNELTELLARFKQGEFEAGGNTLVALTGTAGLLVAGIAKELRRAVEKGSFELNYQPQYDIRNRCIGAEALLRWRHPSHGVMHPPLVLKLAEEIGLLPELEEAIMQRVLDDALRIQHLAHAGVLQPDFMVSVNATIKSLQSEEFVNKLIEGVQERALDPGRLVLEAPESDILNTGDSIMALLIGLLNAGVLLAIDDFSMSETALEYLKTSVFSIVKLDGSREKDAAAMEKDSAGKTKVQSSAEALASTLRLSKELSFLVLAEYVETQEQHARLESLGCMHFQGYLYSEAVPFEKLIKAVKRSPEGKALAKQSREAATKASEKAQ